MANLANHQPSIDLTTMEDVQRLLSTTTFATIDDLMTRGGPVEVDDVPARGPAEVLPSPEGGDPLPRRR